MYNLCVLVNINAKQKFLKEQNYERRRNQTNDKSRA